MGVIKNANVLGIVVCCLIGGLHSWSYRRGEYPAKVVPEDYERRDFSPYEDSYVEEKEDERAYEDMMREMERRRHYRKDPFQPRRSFQKRNPRRFDSKYYDHPKDLFMNGVSRTTVDFEFPRHNTKRKITCHPACHAIETFAPGMCKNAIARSECECICDHTRTNIFTPQTLKCGKKSTVTSDFYKRIVGGSESKAGEWPWVVSINSTLINQTESNVWCSGSILSERFILTAMNPFDADYVEMDPKYWSITAGSLKINDGGKDKQVRKVKKIMRHNNVNNYLYKNATGKLFVLLSHDIALLELETPLNFDDSNGKVGSLCLISDRDQKLSDDCYVAGWGYDKFFPGLDFSMVSNELQSVQMPAVSHSECNSVYDNLIPPEILCAGWKSGGKDACLFDSGSALACKGTDHWYANGIVSTGYNCAEPNGYSFYTPVYLYTDWIIETILNLKS